MPRPNGFDEWVAQRFGPEQTGVSPVSYEYMQEAWLAALAGGQAKAEVQKNSLGKLDEFIAHNADVHLERMNGDHWWLGVTMTDGMFWHINFTTKRNARIECFAESEQH